MVQVSPAGEPLAIHNAKKGGEVLSGSSASLRSGELRPSGSATSKVSKHSTDSGFDGNDLEDDDIDEYANIITENSDGAIIQEIEREFQATELGEELVIASFVVKMVTILQHKFFLCFCKASLTVNNHEVHIAFSDKYL